jgi:hypothetical protein
MECKATEVTGKIPETNINETVGSGRGDWVRIIIIVV